MNIKVLNIILNLLETLNITYKEWKDIELEINNKYNIQYLNTTIEKD